MAASLAIVTGGGGFIGQHLVRKLVARGQSVRIVEKPGTKVAHPVAGVEVAFADIRNRESLRAVLQGAGTVYHLAANPQLWTRRRKDFQDVNTLGTINVLELALAAGAERVLHCSTESILTRVSQDEPIREDQDVPEREVIGPYCRSKYFAEKFARKLATESKPVIIVNPTLPVGPGDRGLSPPTQLILDCCRGKRGAYLDADLNLIDARDVAEGMMLAMAKGIPGRRYLLGAENWTVKHLFEFLADATGHRRPRWEVPYPVALVVAHVNEWVSDVITGRMPVASVKGVKLTRRTMTFDASRSLTELGLKPRSVSESLREEIGWLRENGFLTK
jgi:dihydroflavonol-4-reductase